MWPACIPVEIGVSSAPEAIVAPLPNTESEPYLAKVRVASSSLVSRLDTQVPRLG
jgi:hypothetical protein